jgi:hypothetical protein
MPTRPRADEPGSSDISPTLLSGESTAPDGERISISEKNDKRKGQEMLYTAQPMIERMIETQHSPKDYDRIRPFYTGLASDWWANIDAGESDRRETPSRISRFISSVGTTLHIL